jgi:hypothetical protein
MKEGIAQLSQSLFRVRQLFSFINRWNPFPPAWEQPAALFLS